MKSDNFDNTKIVEYGTLSRSTDDLAVVIPFDTKAGQEYFSNSKHKNPFFKLAPNYVPQNHVTTCGIASAVMVLNTIYVTNQKQRPLSMTGSCYIEDSGTLYANRIWDQDNFFNDSVCSILDKDVVKGKKKVSGQYAPGVNLAELSMALRSHELTVMTHHVDSIELEQIKHFRDLIKQITINIDHYMIVNYELSLLSPKLKQGHFAPVAAYDTETDRVLLLDPWSSFTPWIWVSLVDLYKSMHTLDNKKYRGYLLIVS